MRFSKQWVSVARDTFLRSCYTKSLEIGFRFWDCALVVVCVVVLLDDRCRRRGLPPGLVLFAGVGSVFSQLHCEKVGSGKHGDVIFICCTCHGFY